MTLACILLTFVFVTEVAHLYLTTRQSEAVAAQAQAWQTALLQALTPPPPAIPSRPPGEVILVDRHEREEIARVAMPHTRTRKVQFGGRTYEQARQVGINWIYRESA